MYELKKIGKVFTSKSFGTGPSSYEKRIYRAAVSQRLRNTGLRSSVSVSDQVCNEMHDTKNSKEILGQKPGLSSSGILSHERV